MKILSRDDLKRVLGGGDDNCAARTTAARGISCDDNGGNTVTNEVA